MRFAWLRQIHADDVSIGQAFSLPITLIRIAYNAAFWIFLIPFFTRIDFSVGFIALTTIVLLRLGANLYANHVFKSEAQKFDRFPFRA